MAKQSFARPDPTVEETAPETESGGTATAIVEAPPRALAPAEPNGEPAQVEGEVDYSDINLDRINLVQKSGALSDQFEPGSFLLGREVILSKADGAFDFIVLRIKKQYQEDLPYDASGNGPMPKRFNTSAEVRAEGGSLIWGDENYYRDIATALVLIPAPATATQEDKESKFIYEAPDGNSYALALWTFVKTSYTAVAKKIFTAKLVGHLKTGFEHGVWRVSSEKKTNAGNTWFQPVVKPAGKTTPEFQLFAKEVLSSLA